MYTLLCRQWYVVMDIIPNEDVLSAFSDYCNLELVKYRMWAALKKEKQSKLQENTVKKAETLIVLLECILHENIVIYMSNYVDPSNLR